MVGGVSNLLIIASKSIVLQLIIYNLYIQREIQKQIDKQIDKQMPSVNRQSASSAWQQTGSQLQSEQLNVVIHQLQYCLYQLSPRQLSSHIETNPYQPLQQLKQYITIYVQNHFRSQQLFNLMCEHNMLAKLFTRVSKPIFVLQTFNLLLANTHQLSQLVYIFSHPFFHNYILVGFENIVQLGSSSNSNSNNQMSKITAYQCIEYYVQLLKTLVMKLQGEINQCTLLKLFCNSKYSYFPLLTNCILLAIKRNIKQQLVRVTAQHCILQLIGIMARKKVGQCYFSNIHMVIFYYEIIAEMIQQQTTKSKNMDTTIKYVVDLLKAISCSASVELREKGLLLFFNILSNSLTFKFFKHPAPALHLLLKLSTLFTQIPQLTTLSHRYLTPIYHIISKLLFNKYLNNVTLSSIILVSECILQLSQMRDVQLLKLIKSYYQRHALTVGEIEVKQEQGRFRHVPIFGNKSSRGISSSRYKSNAMIASQQDTLYDKYSSHVMKQIDNYNLNNTEFFELKQNYYKKFTSSPSFLSTLGSLFKKINVFDIISAEYIKKLMQIASIRYVSQQSFSFLQQVFAPTAVYLFEFFRIKNKQKYVFGQTQQDTEKTQISFNQNRDQFMAQTEFFKVVLNIAELAFTDLDIIDRKRKQAIQILQHQYQAKLISPGEVYFTLHFRQFFQHSMFEFICTNQAIKHRTEITPKLINYLYKLSSQLELQITENNRNKIILEINKIQNQLLNTIKIKGFQDFFEYMDSGKQQKMTVQNENITMLTSTFRFDNQHTTNRLSLSSLKKKRSIFGAFRNSTSSIEIDRSSTKQSSQLKQIQCQMLHLQLLRFILQNSSHSQGFFAKVSRLQAKPLHKLFEENFISEYKGYHESLYELKGVRFNLELDCECMFKIKAKMDDFTVVVELYHQSKLILKCNALDFTLSQLKQDLGSSQAVGVDEQQNKKFIWYVTILPTANMLGFFQKQKAQQLINTLSAIKEQYRSVKENSILMYLNKKEQYAKKV